MFGTEVNVEDKIKDLMEAMEKMQESMDELKKESLKVQKDAGLVAVNLRSEIADLRGQKLEKDVEIEQLKGKVRDLMKEKKHDDDDGGDNKHIKDVRYFDSKNAPKPDKYDCGVEQYHAWHELFVATLIAQDASWDRILKSIEKYGKKMIKKEDVENIKTELGMSGETLENIMRMLYVMMIQYTTGSTQGKVIGGGTEEIFETYRYVVWKGRNATVQTMMDKRTSVMNPVAATTLAEVEACMATWKSDIKYLEKAKNAQDIAMLANHDQMIAILMNMVPETAKEYLINKYEENVTTFDEIEKHLDEYLGKKNIEKNPKAKGGIKQVTIEKAEKQAEIEDEQKYNYEEIIDDKFGTYWICTAIPAAKRQRAENDGGEDARVAGPGERGKGGAKGGARKGGKGPPGGCHECGGDHFVRDCAVRQAKNAAKAKRKEKVSRTSRRAYGAAGIQDTSGHRSGVTGGRATRAAAKAKEKQKVGMALRASSTTFLCLERYSMDKVDLKMVYGRDLGAKMRVTSRSQCGGRSAK